MRRRTTIHVKGLSVKKLFETHIFNVPNYQRSYSWGKKERRDLFNDIKDDIKRKEDVFMSTIVALLKERNNEYDHVDLVDGQQRITTLVLLLKAICLVKKDLGKRDIELENLIIKKSPGVSIPILSQGNNKSSVILRNFIINDDLNPQGVNTFAKKNLKDAIDECYQFIKYEDYWEKEPHSPRDIESIEAIKDILLNRYRLVYCEMPEEKEVYKTFETVNSRGLPVSALDNFKSQLMGVAFAENDNSAVEELHKIWSEIYDVIGLEKINEDDIISISATLYKSKNDTKTRPRSVVESTEYFYKVATQDEEIKNDEVPNILKHQDKSLDTKGFRCQKISELIKKMASTMVSIHKDETLEAVTDVKQARVLLIAIELSNFTDAEKKELRDAWEKTSFRLYCLHRKDSRSLIGEFVGCAHEVIDGKKNVDEIIKSIKSIGAQYSLDEGIEKVKGSAWYPDYNNDVIYILRKYDEYLAEQAGAIINSAIWQAVWKSDPADTIEHIFPKTYPKNESDINRFNKDWGHGGRRWSQAKLNEFVHNIGNLTILPPKQNGQAGQKPYDEKINLYGNLMRIHPERNSPYLEKRKAGSYWTEKSIKAREQEILNFIKLKWS